MGGPSRRSTRDARAARRHYSLLRLWEFCSNLVRRRGMAMDQLKQTYRGAMSSIEQIASQYDGVSGPLFMSVPESYYRASVLFMIVGQHTCGWSSVTVVLDELLRTYEEFDLGREYTRSPFWQASHQVFRGVNLDGPERAFLWSNLVRVDQHRKRPRAEIEEAVSALGLLTREI